MATHSNQREIPNIKIVSVKKLSSDNLLGKEREVMIQHQNETYILRLTKLNKLILTK